MVTSEVVKSPFINPPCISVGLPVYNGERFVGKAIESILKQDFDDFELIISDNASTDDTGRICQEYARQDKRIRYYRNKINLGAAPNHNRVIELARGKYFKWTASDDECLPQFLRQCFEAFKQSDSVVLAYPQAELIDASGKLIGRYTVSISCKSHQPHVRLAHVLTYIDLGTPLYGVVSMEALRKTRLHGSFVSADYALLAELALVGVIWEVPQALLRKRIHPGRSMEANKSVEDYYSWLDTRNMNCRSILYPGDRLTLEYIISVWRLPLRLLTLRDKILCTYVIIKCTQRNRANRWKERAQRLICFKTEVK